MYCSSYFKVWSNIWYNFNTVLFWNKVAVLQQPVSQMRSQFEPTWEGNEEAPRWGCRPNTPKWGQRPNLSGSIALGSSTLGDAAGLNPSPSKGNNKPFESAGRTLFASKAKQYNSWVEELLQMLKLLANKRDNFCILIKGEVISKKSPSIHRSEARVPS